MEPAVLSLAGASVLGATDGSTVSLSVASWLRLGGEVALHRAAPSPLRGRDRSASSRRSRRLSPRSLSCSASSLSLPGRRSPSRSPRPDLRPRSLSRPRSRTPQPGRPGQRSPTPPRPRRHASSAAPSRWTPGWSPGSSAPARSRCCCARSPTSHRSPRYRLFWRRLLWHRCALHKQRVVPALWPFALSAKCLRQSHHPFCAGAGRPVKTHRKHPAVSPCLTLKATAPSAGRFSALPKPKDHQSNNFKQRTQQTTNPSQNSEHAAYTQASGAAS